VNLDFLTKRLFDLLIATVALMVLSPVLAVVAILIYLHDGGPVFYRGQRVGLGGREFAILKFRTMVVNADRIGGSSTADDDPRTTTVGKWLRRYKLDETPQLWNVVVGEMSLVGPRPQVAWAVARYTPEERILLSVRPGITDPASVRFANEGEILKGHSDPDRAYLEIIHPEKMRLSIGYLRSRNFLSDLKVIAATVRAALGNTSLEQSVRSNKTRK
jgi:lipopolysaccharide/colanic/teichoic acid biosynthesis glycosyltransferase